MKFHTFKVMLTALGITEKAPVVEIPGHAIVAARTLQRAISDTVVTEQEMAEFGCPSSRRNMQEV